MAKHVPLPVVKYKRVASTTALSRDRLALRRRERAKITQRQGSRSCRCLRVVSVDPPVLELECGTCKHVWKEPLLLGPGRGPNSKHKAPATPAAVKLFGKYWGDRVAATCPRCLKAALDELDASLGLLVKVD